MTKKFESIKTHIFNCSLQPLAEEKISSFVEVVAGHLNKGGYTVLDALSLYTGLISHIHKETPKCMREQGQKIIFSHLLECFEEINQADK